MQFRRCHGRFGQGKTGAAGADRAGGRRHHRQRYLQPAAEHGRRRRRRRDPDRLGDHLRRHADPDAIFQWLSTTRPELDDGVYGYAREGFGEYLGFNAAWGCWISAWVGNAGYLVVLFSALGSFGALALFGDGTTWPALLGELTVLWLMHAFVLHGVHNAAITNAIVTLAKVVPIALFIPSA